VQTDGKILAAGNTTRAHAGAVNQDFLTVRLNDDGSPDASFGGGSVVTDFGEGDDVARTLAVQDDGRILVAGSASDGRFDFLALARYNPDGTLDPSFERGQTKLREPAGTIVTSVGPSSDLVYALAIQPNDKIVVAGRSLGPVEAGTPHRFVLARYNPDGT